MRGRRVRDCEIFHNLPSACLLRHDWLVNRPLDFSFLAHFPILSFYPRNVKTKMSSQSNGGRQVVNRHQQTAIHPGVIDDGESGMHTLTV
jgi:hypothetical protein